MAEQNERQGNPLLSTLHKVREETGGKYAPPAEAQEEQGGVVADVARGALNGLQEGASELVETIGWAGDEAMFKASGLLTGTEQNYYPGEGWVSREDVLKANRSGEALGFQPIAALDAATDIKDPTTMAGGMVSGVTQFLGGYGVFSKALKVGKSTTTAGNYGRAMAAGAATDFASFDAHEDRFSDFLRDSTGLQDPVTEFLSADEDDTVLEGKLKNAVEGMGLGLAADGVFRLVKAFKGAKSVQKAEGDEAAAEFMNAEIEKIADENPEALQLELFDEVSDPNIQTDAKAGPKKVVRLGEDAPKAEAGEAPQGEAAASVARQNDKNMVPARETEWKPMDTEAFNQAINKEISLVKGGSTPDPNRLVAGKLFNFDKMDSDLDVKDYLNMASDAIPDSLIQDTKTFDRMRGEATDFLSQAVDVSPEIIDASLANMAEGMKKQQGVVLASKMLVQSMSREVEQLAYKISSGNATDTDYAQMKRMQGKLMETSANLKSVIKGAAQTTAAGRIRTSDVVSGDELRQMDISEQIKQMVDGGSREDLDKLAAEIIANKEAGNGLAGTMKITANRNNRNFWGVVNEVRINGLLSGVKTHVVNAVSNTLQLGLLPGEKILGGAVMRDPTIMREGLKQYAGLAMALRDSTKYALMALKQGRNIIDPEAAILEANGVDYHAIQSTSDNAVARNLINGIGTTIRLPSRGLMMSDEFFKQMNYRSDLYSRLTTKAGDLVAEGKITKAEASKWVADRMEAGFSKDGTATHLSSLQHAREATFTNELRRGSLPKKIQDASNKHPTLKILLPFVRTPTNLIVASAQRTPIIRRLSKNLADDLESGDPSRIASAKGKMAFGNMLWGGAIMAAINGQITGNGPVDPTARKRLMETGWRPYSFVINQKDGGKKYVEYGRLDPFAMFFGIAADVADMGGQIGEKEMNELAVAGIAAIANNVASKTWLTGVTDAIDAFNNPEMRMEGYLNGLATSFTPFSSQLRERARGQDGVMRDTRGGPDGAWYEMQSLVNSFKAMVPGMSETLPARRSFITGEPITYPKGWGADMVTPLGDAFASMNPIREGEWKQDLVLDELARLDYAFTPPQRKVLDVELTPEQYEAYVELNGKVRDRSTKRTMYQELAKVMQSPTYDIERRRAPDDPDSSLDTRTRIVRRVMTAYRAIAQEELLRRFPDLRDKVLARKAEAGRNADALLTGVIELGQ